MTDETTSEQLADTSGRDIVRGLVLQVADLIEREEAEIEGQAENTPSTGYTPPEGWRVLAVGEGLRDGDERVQTDESRYATRQVGRSVQAHERYIRRIDTQAKPEPVQVREGRWRTRSGDIRNVTPTPEGDGREERFPWWDAAYQGTWTSDGRYLFGEASPLDLFEYIGPIEPQPETTTEQLAEIDRDMADIERQVAELVEEAQKADYKTQELPDKTQELPEYTPPEGWRLVRFGELLLPGDEIVQIDDGRRYPTHRIGDAVGPNQQYIRRIKPEPQPQAEPQAAAIEELRSEVSYVQNLLGESRQRVTQLEDLVGSLRTINAAQEAAVEAAGKQNDALRAQVRILQREADKKNSRIEFLETLNAGNGAAISDYRAQVQKLQGLVDTARGQLETAATEHDSLSTQLEAVKTELVTQAETSRRLQIELDAAQQVPADSPELRQLRADLAEVGHDRDMYRHAHELLLQDIDATHARTKAMTVEAIVEWLEPIRREDPHLRAVILFHLPKIMRSLVGLNTPEDVD